MAADSFTLDDVRRALAQHAPVRMPELGRPSAVLVGVFERDGQVRLLLTKRTDAMPTHAGQVSFPGGKTEPGDPHPAATALREAQEEVGLDPRVVEVVGQLDDCPTFVSHYVITPVVGIIPARYPYLPSADEIDVLLEPALEDFLRPGALRLEQHERGGLTYELHYYDVVGHTVWGATGRILHGFFELLRQARER